MTPIGRDPNPLFGIVIISMSGGFPEAATVAVCVESVSGERLRHRSEIRRGSSSSGRLTVRSDAALRSSDCTYVSLRFNGCAF